MLLNSTIHLLPRVRKLVIMLVVSLLFQFSGLSFWKSPHRNLYGVPPLKDSDPFSAKKQIVLDSESDDDFVEPQRKRPCPLSSSSTNRSLEIIRSDIAELKHNIAEVVTLSATMKCPLALRHVLRDSFQCKICRIVPLRPPVILMKCCK